MTKRPSALTLLSFAWLATTIPAAALVRFLLWS